VTDQARWADSAYRIETPAESVPDDETDDEDDG
jgi:hypothetical protein